VLVGGPRQDQHRYEPSTFTYFLLDPGMKVWVTFEIDPEAEAFATGIWGFSARYIVGKWASQNGIALPTGTCRFNLYDLLQRQGWPLGPPPQRGHARPLFMAREVPACGDASFCWG